MALIDFEDPGRRRGAPAIPTALVALREVMERPATWARIATYASGASASSFVTRLRRRLGETPQGTFEFTVRTQPDGCAYVYAIFLPDEIS